MDEKDQEEFLKDFKKADLSQKLDMWVFALDQQMIWDEILSDMSKIARKLILKERRGK
ncbi:MAG: hypothetical protein V5A68_00335 [Candidatus Thermoplasmatota archaeon]